MVARPPRQISLEQLSIASPCSAKWDDMTGDERRRLCEDCGLHVHNISGMSQGEAEHFLTEVVANVSNGKRVCVRMYKRADGTVLTKNCPVGLAAIRSRAWAGIRRVAAVATVAIVAVFALRREEANAAMQRSNRWAIPVSVCRSVRPFSWISEKLGKERPWLRGQFISGVVMLPPPPTPVDHAKSLLEEPKQ